MKKNFNGLVRNRCKCAGVVISGGMVGGGGGRSGDGSVCEERWR